MKRLFSTISVLLALVFTAAAQTADYGTANVEFFRAGRDREFRNPQLSPLKPEDLPQFQGLNYFPIEPTFRVVAKFTKTPDEKFFMMPTSRGTARKYVKVGVLNFKIAGKDYVLNAYQSERSITDDKLKETKSALFVPFRDLTSGRETYGVGRYLSLYAPAGEQATLDFNLAYNPSCAYGDESFSCPIPPKENFLQVEIKAGEKSYLKNKANTLQEK